MRYLHGRAEQTPTRGDSSRLTLPHSKEVSLERIAEVLEKTFFELKQIRILLERRERRLENED
jgi:hypothetical protein